MDTISLPPEKSSWTFARAHGNQPMPNKKEMGKDVDLGCCHSIDLRGNHEKHLVVAVYDASIGDAKSPKGTACFTFDQ